MRCFLVIGALVAINIFAAEEEDIFAEFDRMEIDKEYQDDFLGFNTIPTQNLAASGLITHPYNNYSERSWVRNERSLSGLISQETINQVYYMTLFPQARFKLWQLYTHLGLPMRFPLYDNIRGGALGLRRRGFVPIKDFVAPRPADYRSFADAFKIIRHMEWGKLSDAHYAGLVREQAFTLAQGDLMRELNTEYLYDQDYLFAHARLSFEQIGVEAVLGPIPALSILGLNTSIKPLGDLSNNSLIKNMSFDLSYVGDYQAPGQVHVEEDAYVLEADRRLVKRDKHMAHGASLGLATLYEPFSWFGSKPYTSFSNLWLSGPKNTTYGLAFNLGHDLSFYFTGAKQDSALFLRTEARLFSENYEPNYFGSNLYA